VPTDAAPLSPAERVRRHRAMRRRGLVLVRVPIQEVRMVNWLIDRGRLAEDDAADPEAVAGALARLLRDVSAD